MALSFTTTDARKLVSTLDPEYDEWKAEVKTLKKAVKDNPDDEDAQQRLTDLQDRMAEAEGFAMDALEVAWGVAQDKAKFTVVGQLKRGADQRIVDPSSDEADKVALGWYPTEKQAVNDALKLAYSQQTHEEFRAWVLPLHLDTPNSYYVQRKKAKQQAEADIPLREQEVRRRQKWYEDHPDETPPPEFNVVIPFDNELEDCPMCDGTGKIKREESA